MRFPIVKLDLGTRERLSTLLFSLRLYALGKQSHKEANLSQKVLSLKRRRLEFLCDDVKTIFASIAKETFAKKVLEDPNLKESKRQRKSIDLKDHNLESTRMETKFKLSKSSRVGSGKVRMVSKDKLFCYPYSAKTRLVVHSDPMIHSMGFARLRWHTYASECKEF